MINFSDLFLQHFFLLSVSVMITVKRELLREMNDSDVAEQELNY